MSDSWVGFFTAALTGGVVVKLMEFIFQSFQSEFHRARTAKEIVDIHFDPLMKAADEIVGKTRSLAERDFQELILATTDNVNTSNRVPTEILALLYLYAQFWGRIEILRQESVGVSLSKDKRGAKLKDFIACLESQRIRLVNRVHQKAIGELSIILKANGKFQSIGIVNFSRSLSEDEEMKYWIEPLISKLGSVKAKKTRQRVLVYGVVTHALIDTLDPKHTSTNWRPSYPNKLSKNSKRDVKYRVFGKYLKYVKNTKKYVGYE